MQEAFIKDNLFSHIYTLLLQRVGQTLPVCRGFSETLARKIFAQVVIKNRLI